MYNPNHLHSAAAVAARVRVFPDALARELANEKPDSLRVVVLNALYNRMSPADQLRCKAELHRIRTARRAVLNESDAFGRREGEAVILPFPPPVTAPANA